MGRTDGTKMLYGKQRMRYEGAAGIGTWYAVFESLSLAGIIVNAFIIVFTSQSFSLRHELSNTDKLVVVIGLEHALLLIKFAVVKLVPDQPTWVRTTQDYRDFLKGDEYGGYLQNGEHKNRHQAHTKERVKMLSILLEGKEPEDSTSEQTKPPAAGS